MMAWYGRYIGIPFIDQGFDHHGCHCWGLVHLIYREQLAIDLPRYGELSAAELLEAARQFRAGAGEDPRWTTVTSPQAFDVVLMSAMTAGARPLRVPGHAGVMVDDDRILHVWSETDAVVMRRDHPRIRHKILSFHRHRS
jgi:cell wall-associated NlpC family hydrolase